MDRSLVRVFGAFLRSIICLVIVLGISRATDAGSPTIRATTDQTAVFPVSIASSKRYLLDASARPFLIQGDAAWSLIASLTREEVEFYFSDRKARGFNTILVSLIEHRFSKNAPANAYRQKPFRIQGDFSKPNESYFAHADWVLRRAAELGFLVLLAPAYTGNGGGDEGWYEEMIASGADKLRAYGRFLGGRYSDLNNIIWVHAGDYNPPDKSLIRAIVEGIAESAPAHLHTAHGAPETAALDYWPGEPWLALNTIYTYGRVLTKASEQNSRYPQMPFFLIESAYENEHDAAEQRLRTQAYEAMLSGAAGHVFGNNPIWHFDGPGLYEAPVDWKRALRSRGSQSMRHLRKLLDSLAWWTLKPEKGLIVISRNASYGEQFTLLNLWSAHERAVGAIATDGSVAIVYLPSLHGIEINLAQLRGKIMSMRWYDPSEGSYVRAQANVTSNSASMFTPPGLNHAGLEDWVLLLEAGS